MLPVCVCVTRGPLTESWRSWRWESLHVFCKNRWTGKKTCSHPTNVAMWPHPPSTTESGWKGLLTSCLRPVVYPEMSEKPSFATASAQGLLWEPLVAAGTGKSRGCCMPSMRWRLGTLKEQNVSEVFTPACEHTGDCGEQLLPLRTRG